MFVENAQERINNRKQKKENSFGVKYGIRKDITEMLDESRR